MKQFACGSVIDGCQSVFRAPNEEAVLAQVADHAHEHHGVTEVSEELEETIREHIVSIAA